MAPFHDIQLTLEAADVIRIPSADGKVALEVSPSFITAGLIQGWRDREARVTLVHAGTHDIELTVAEAAELAEALADLRPRGHGGRRRRAMTAPAAPLARSLHEICEAVRHVELR